MSFITLSAFKRHFHMVRECAFAPDSELSHTSSPPFRPYIILLQLKIWPVGYQLWGHHRAPLDAGDHCFSISCNPSYFQSNSFFFLPVSLGSAARDIPRLYPSCISSALSFQMIVKFSSLFFMVLLRLTRGILVVFSLWFLSIPDVLQLKNVWFHSRVSLTTTDAVTELSTTTSLLLAVAV